MGTAFITIMVPPPAGWESDKKGITTRHPTIGTKSGSYRPYCFACRAIIQRPHPKPHIQATRIITPHPKAPASRTAQEIHPLPLRLISAFQPLSAHNALARISRSLPNCRPFEPPTTESRFAVGFLGESAISTSVQSSTRTRGMVELVV
jgi:hypothetical protein